MASLSRNVSAFSLLLAAGFAALLCYFGMGDFYHRHFADSGVGVIFYQLCRTAYIFYLAWILYFTGHALLARTAPQSYAAMNGLPQAIAAFFTGAGVWHVGLLIVGVLGWYRKEWMVVLTIAVLALSLPHLTRCLARRPHAGRAAMFNLAAFVLFLLFKGLYPGGGHDYFQHYFPYYLEVVQSGSIGPNAVWYQFFYSRGAGLYFLSMLLTDPLAPQLVTVCLMLGANAIIHAWLRQLAGAGAAWIGGGLYWLGLIYTPGDVFSGWAHLEKLHEILAVLVLAMLWLGWRLWQTPTRAEKHALAWVCVGAVIVQTISAAIVLPFLGALWALACGRKEMRKALLTAAILTMAVTCAMLALNYQRTGIVLDQKIVALWPLLQWEKLHALNAVFEALLLRIEHERMAADPVALADMPGKIIEYLRMNLWGVVLLAALMLRRMQEGHFLPVTDISTRQFLSVIGVLAGIVVLLAFFAGRFNPISFYRLTSFSYAPALLLALWSIPWPRVWAYIRCGWIFALVALVTVSAMPQVFSPLKRLWQGPLMLAMGTYSLRDAYRNQDHFLTAMLPGGAISDGMEQVRSITGGARVRTLSDPVYCMAPGCVIESMMSFTLGQDAQHLLTRSGEEGVEILKHIGLNYFFVSLDGHLNDILVLTPVFSPETIGRFLAVHWTDGTHYLLTWPKQETSPLPASFLERYRQLAQKSNFLTNFPMDRYKELLHSSPVLSKGPSDGKT